MEVVFFGCNGHSEACRGHVQLHVAIAGLRRSSALEGPGGLVFFLGGGGGDIHGYQYQPTDIVGPSVTDMIL